MIQQWVTLDKMRLIQDKEFSYESIWECQFDQCKVNEDLKSMTVASEIVSPLEPRDAFFGGRTEAFTLFSQADRERKINYYDVTSLYPFINKTGKVPLGHPEIITDAFTDRENYEGLIKCKILPKKETYIPVLLYKSNGKLMLGLCHACTEFKQQMPYNHSDEQLAITGTWVTDEVKRAIEKGYQLLQIYEVWHFQEVAQYDPITKSEGMFTDYINKFLKIKQEASGLPKWFKTDDDKRKYIQDYYDREGIWLNANNIKKNPGLRQIAKLMLNSF